MYRTSVALEAMAKMHYDAITIGERELSMGYEYLKGIVDQKKLPVITTNLYYNGERFGEPYRIFEKKNLKIGVVSARMKLGTRKSEIWDIRDHNEELRKILPELDSKCDLIVVLSHLGFTKSFDLADEFPEIDVIIAAHGSRKTTEPTPVGNAVRTKPGKQGKGPGRLDLEVSPDNKVESFKGTMITLGPKLSEDPTMVAFYEAYKDSAAKLPSSGTEKKEVDPLSQVEGSDYKGSRWCRSCHVREFNAWLKTPHSSAFSHLKKTNQSEDGDCLRCHTTGYGDGGFANLDETPVLVNVQCESCHGKGKEHIRSKGNTRTAEVVNETCTVCHDKKWDPDFNFEVKKALVH